MYTCFTVKLSKIVFAWTRMIVQFYSCDVTEMYIMFIGLFFFSWKNSWVILFVLCCFRQGGSVRDLGEWKYATKAASRCIKIIVLVHRRLGSIQCHTDSKQRILTIVNLLKWQLITTAVTLCWVLWSVQT